MDNSENGNLFIFCVRKIKFNSNPSMNSVDSVLYTIRSNDSELYQGCQILCTIGNQKSFACSAYTLYSNKFIRVWDGQRALVDSRVKELRAYQDEYFRRNKTYAFRGVLLFCKTREDDYLWIIDGQHRYATILSLVQDGALNFLVKFDVLELNSRDDILKEFQDVNRSVPVPILYLNPNQVVSDAIKLLEDKFQDSFRPIKTSRPRICTETFGSILIKHNIAERFKFDKYQLFNALCKLHQFYKSCKSEELIDRLARGDKTERKRINNYINRCRNDEFMFVGIFKIDNEDWIKDLIALC